MAKWILKILFILVAPPIGLVLYLPFSYAIYCIIGYLVWIAISLALILCDSTIDDLDFKLHW